MSSKEEQLKDFEGKFTVHVLYRLQPLLMFTVKTDTGGKSDSV